LRSEASRQNSHFAKLRFAIFVSLRSVIFSEILVNLRVNIFSSAHLVGNSDDQSVLGGVVLVLVLDTESLSGEVVGLSFSSSSELDLVSLEVGLVLLNGNESSLGTSTSFLSHGGLESIQQRSEKKKGLIKVSERLTTGWQDRCFSRDSW
jgi:hypothetical protein